MEVGSWKLEVGKWKSEVGSQELEVGSRELEIGSWKSGVGSCKDWEYLRLKATHLVQLVVEVLVLRCSKKLTTGLWTILLQITTDNYES